MATSQVYTSPEFVTIKDPEGMVYRSDVEADCTTVLPRSQVYITDVTAAAEISNPLTEQVIICEVPARTSVSPPTDTVTLGARPEINNKAGFKSHTYTLYTHAQSVYMYIPCTDTLCTPQPTRPSD